MISPELLRRFPFFAHLDDTQLKAIAMLSNEVTYAKGETLFQTDQSAHALFILVEGLIDLHYVVIDRDNPTLRKDFYVGHINPGEPFGISALIEPYQYTATALANSLCRVIEIAAPALRILCEKDLKLDSVLAHHIATTALSRLHDTRLQLIGTHA